MGDQHGASLPESPPGLNPGAAWWGSSRRAGEQWEQGEQEAKKKKTRVRREGTRPAHDLKEYAGDYIHPGYGTARITLRQGRLETTYNGIETPLEHWHFETFNALKAADDAMEDTKLTFVTDVKGNVAALAVAMEPTVKDAVFEKKPDASLSDPAYLARFVGDYEVFGQPLAIGLKGNALVVQSPGQQPAELVPALGGEFVFKAGSVISIRFTEDPKGRVTGGQLIQPKGIFDLKRK